MHTRDARASLAFFLEGEKFASRYWFHVPRVGDEIVFRDQPYKVSRVVWPGDQSDVAQANIEITEILDDE